MDAYTHCVEHYISHYTHPMNCVTKYIYVEMVLYATQGKAAEKSNIIPGKTYPYPGCTSFFWKDVDELSQHSASNMISTICTCDEAGQTVVPNYIMSEIGASREDGN